MRNKAMIFVFLLLILAKPSNGVLADEANTLSRFDGIIMNCRVTDLVKFERKLCAKVVVAIEKMSAASNIPLKNIGVFVTKSASQALDEELQDHGFQKPLILRILVAGTKGRTAGSIVQVLAGNPRQQGFLLLWDRRVLARGRVRKIIQVVPGVMAKHVKKLLAKMKDGQDK